MLKSNFKTVAYEYNKCDLVKVVHRKGVQHKI